MEAGLHRQLARARQAVAWWVMACRDGETDLVVELGRRRNVAFLLDVESHAGGPDRIGATLRSDRPGDNCLGGLCPYANCFAAFKSRLLAKSGGAGCALALLVVTR